MPIQHLSPLTEHAWIYRQLQASVGSNRLWKWFVQDEVLPHQPKRILDLGCGTSDILAHLPTNIDYVGMDPNPSYIESAQRRYPHTGQWHSAPVTMDSVAPLGSFDLVLLLGVLHHCNDETAAALLKIAQTALRPGGVMIHLDGCIHPDAGWLETMLYRLERGLYVRHQEGYASLMATVYEAPTQEVKDGLLRLPYRYCVGKGVI